MLRSLLVLLLLWPLAAHAGLDVTAYRGLAPVASPQLDEEGEPVGPQQVMLDPVDMPERFEPLTPGVYHYEAQFEFRAGSYSWYNDWRNELAKLGGHEPMLAPTLEGKREMRHDARVWQDKRGPFWELIDFSDAEGVIGPAACKRIHADFVRFHEAAMAHPDEDFRASYEDWMKGFALCADGGAIVFH